MNIKDRFDAFIAYKGLSRRGFQEKIEVSNSYIQNISKGVSDKVLNRISIQYPELNRDWLLTGMGEMIISTKQTDKTIFPTPSSTSIPNTKCTPIIDIDYKLVPIIHVDSVGGMYSPNAIVGEPQYIEGYAPFTAAKDGDICIIQSGNSMTPTCPSGSLLLLRRVSNWKEYFGYGNIFVIELSDGRRITKEVSRYDENPKDFIWCISHNPNVPDEELPKNIIVSVWKVIKIQIDKGW